LNNTNPQRLSSTQVERSGGTFSLEGHTGKAFHTRSRLFTDEDWAQIEGQLMRDLA
jgi:hypothetical protein